MRPILLDRDGRFPAHTAATRIASLSELPPLLA
jgi:hypothetical protein